MKRCIILLSFLLLFPLSVGADPVSPERAAQTAASFFAPVTKASEPAVRLVASFPEPSTKSAGVSPSLYVFACETGGFVVISGDDVAVPVIGYALSGDFPLKDMPVNMRSHLDWHASIIDYARSNGWKPSAETTAAWSRVAAASGSSDKVVLETAKWGQGTPYNDLCPTEDGQKCPSGCVATAMAIIMRYYQYPERGTGVLPDYDYAWDYAKQEYLYHIDGYALGHVYDWDKMPLEYQNGQYSSEEAAQVAQLMYDLGVMSQMDYAPGGSGAASDSPIGMVQYFGYDRQMRYCDRAQFSDRQWEQIIRDEIDAGRPVFHCGSSERGGHAFVIDGYQGDYFRINYGWSGGSQFYLLTPSVEGISNKVTEFVEWQDMVTHIMPDLGGEGYVNLAVPYQYAPFPWDFRSETFEIDPIWLWYYTSSGEGEVEMRYALFDRDGRFKAPLSDSFMVSSDECFVPAVTCQVPDKIADGDCIMLARADGDGWTPVPQSRNSYRRFDRTRTLADMVSVGHALKVRKTVGTGACLYLVAYKDIWWEIWSEELGAVVVDARSSFLHQDTEAGKVVFEIDYQDPDSDTYNYYFFLPVGHYRVTFRNFEEELVFTVTL